MYHFSFSFAFQGVTAQSHVAEMQQREVRPGNGVGATRPVTRTTHPVRDLRGQFRWLAPEARLPKERLIAGALAAAHCRELICHWNTRDKCLQ